MSDENRQPINADPGDTGERAREVYDDATGALERSERIRAADGAQTDERQEELARMEAEAAERLRRNAETLRRTAEDLAETKERMRRVAADTRELAADVRATREDTSRVGDEVRSTPPIVEPPAGDR
jgi:phage shock protein A